MQIMVKYKNELSAFLSYKNAMVKYSLFQWNASRLNIDHLVFLNVTHYTRYNNFYVNHI